MNYAFETLTQVMKGDLPFDRTIKVSMTESLEKDQVMGHAHNWPPSLPSVNAT
ncbi:MAG: hypothetical protein R3C49_02410 [Planctomycetaceae bacterium]